MKSYLYRIFFRLARALGISEIQSRLDELTNATESLAQDFDRRFNRNFDDLIKMIQSVDRLNETRTRKLVLDLQTEQQITLSSHAEDLNTLRSSIIQSRRDLDGIRYQTQSIRNSGYEDSRIPETEQTEIDQSLYISLEDRFRGDPEIVGLRQREYLPYVSNVVTVDNPLLDLGCGRGEWLRILQSEGLPAKGIDNNEVAVQECLSFGLDVTKDELISSLVSIPAQSIGAVTMFQVLEHLPFNLVVEVLRQSLRILVPGGVFIGEIPNSETLRVGASTFWIDPTHQRPLFPAVLEFLASQVGFKAIEGRYSSPLEPPLDLVNVPAQLATILKNFHQVINGPGDFAIIAKA